MASGLLDSELPLVGAPMAGGPTGVSLAEAISRAGAFPMLAAANKSPEAMAEEISEARSWGRPFGVNLFITGVTPNDAGPVERYRSALAAEAADYGLTLEQPPLDDDDQWPGKLELLRQDPVGVVSFTFGLPPAAEIAQLRRVGTTVLSTVTTPDEARAAVEAGVDALVVQGPSAGGHSGTWDPERSIADQPTAEAVRSVKAATSAPVIAAGGVDGPEAARTLVEAGAEAVQVGTLLLRTEESGASALHKNALASPRFTETAITRAFTGRPARGLRNAFIQEHEADAVTAYPAVHHMTRELRRRAAEAGDVERVHFWAGTGFRAATTGPAADTIRHLCSSL